MKTLLFFLGFLIGFALVAASYAGDWDSDQPYTNGVTPNYRYQGISGQRYQYDLSRPSDRLRYQVDPNAQLRDRVNPSPMIPLDRGLNQYGGGAKP